MGLQREFTKATKEFGEVRITVCRSTLASDRGEMDRALFLLSLSMERGVENLEPTGEMTMKAEGLNFRMVFKKKKSKLRFSLPSPDPI